MSSPSDEPLVQSWTVEARIPPSHVDTVMRCCMGGVPDLTLRGQHSNLLLCALPKSASIHVTQLLALSLDFTSVPVAFGLRGGRAYYPRLVLAKYAGKNTVSHCHNPADASLRRIVERMQFRPIVLWRNLLDALVSRRDMSIDQRSATGMLSAKAFERFLTAPNEEQIDITIDLYGPTYINFAASWLDHEDDPVLRPVFATFDEMKRDEVSMVERIAAELEIPFDRARAQAASDRIRATGGVHLSKRGKGKSGRGRELINAAQIDRLRRMAIVFGCEDESFLGFSLDVPGRPSPAGGLRPGPAVLGP